MKATRNSQRKFHPRLLKSVVRELARLTPADPDDVLVKGEGHGFSKLDHFSPSNVEDRIQGYLRRQTN